MKVGPGRHVVVTEGAGVLGSFVVEVLLGDASLARTDAAGVAH